MARKISDFKHQSLHEGFYVHHVSDTGMIYSSMFPNLSIHSSELKLIQTIHVGSPVDCVCDSPELLYVANHKIYTGPHELPFAGHIHSIVYHPIRETHIASANSRLWDIRAGSISVILGTDDAILSPVSSELSANIYFLTSAYNPNLRIVNTHTNESYLISLNLNIGVDPYLYKFWLTRIMLTPGTLDGLTVFSTRIAQRIDLWQAGSARLPIYQVEPFGDREMSCMTYVTPYVTAIVHASNSHNTVHLHDIRCRTSRKICTSDNILRQIWHATPNGISNLYLRTAPQLLRLM